MQVNIIVLKWNTLTLYIDCNFFLYFNIFFIIEYNVKVILYLVDDQKSDRIGYNF